MRYIRLYGYFLRFCISRTLEFRWDFFFRIFMDIVFYTVSFLFFKIIYMNTSSFGGLNEEQGMIFVCTMFIHDGIVMTFLANNFWYLPEQINSGDLDYYLTRPVSEKFFLCLRDISPSSFINFFMAIGLFIWSIHNYSQDIPLINWISFFISVLNGAYIYFLIRMLFVLPVFWTHSGRGFDQIFWGLEQIGERPDSIFTGKMKVFVTYIIPIALVSSYPCKILIFGPQKEYLYPIILMTSVFTFIFFFLWKLALRNYSSASS